MPGQAWKDGSSRAWREARLPVLAAARYRCQVKTSVCTGRATQVHHTVAREMQGDNPANLVASCAECNQHVGDPRKHDPNPRPRTRW